MFQNIIEQSAALQLKEDFLLQRLAPSMLFYGPPDTGKSSTALELARILSCEETKVWNCSCSSCKLHRYLLSSDLLVLGKRSFVPEISACKNAFLRNPESVSAKLLFIRSIRKLQLRFSPVLIEGDSKLSSLTPVLQALEENMNLFWKGDEIPDLVKHEKAFNSLAKDAFTLADEVPQNIPIDHIRRAAYWCRLAPNGKHKIIIIENAQFMRDDSRNSLLKILEEPPVTVSIILTSPRREVIIPTILSRLRPYRFLKRSFEGEKEIIRRVFQDPGFLNSLNDLSTPKGSSLISFYLDSFYEHNKDTMYPLVSYFIASITRMVYSILKKKNINVPWLITALGERYAPIADKNGFNRSVKSPEIVKTVTEKTNNFENSSFPVFLKLFLDLINDVTRTAPDPHFLIFTGKIKKCTEETNTAVSVLNQNKTLALESLVFNLKDILTKEVYD